MLAKPRTVWACHLVAAMNSASVAPLARFISVITSAFLLTRSAFGLLAGILARPSFFVSLAFLAAVRLPFPLRSGRFGYRRFLRIDWVRVHFTPPLTGWF